MWVWRRMERVKWTDKIKNSVMLERVGERRIMLELIRKRKRNWLTHWLRRNCLLKDALEHGCARVTHCVTARWRNFSHCCRPLRQYDIWITCSEYREALTARRQHTVNTNKRLQCKYEVHSSPLNKYGGFVTSHQWMGDWSVSPSVAWFAHPCSRRYGKWEESSRQKKISDDRKHYDKWTVWRYEKEGWEEGRVENAEFATKDLPLGKRLWMIV